MSKRTSRRKSRAGLTRRPDEPHRAEAADGSIDRAVEAVARTGKPGGPGGGEAFSSELVTVAFVVAGLTSLALLGVQVFYRIDGGRLIPDLTDRVAFDLLRAQLGLALLPCGVLTLLLWPVVELVRRRRLPLAVTVGLGMAGGLAVLVVLCNPRAGMR